MLRRGSGHVRERPVKPLSWTKPAVVSGRDQCFGLSQVSWQASVWFAPASLEAAMSANRL